MNWSWSLASGSPNFANTNNVYSGTTVIRVEYLAAWAGLYLRSPSQITGNYNTLTFAARRQNNNGPSAVRVLFYDSPGTATHAQTITLTNSWQVFTVPMGSYALSNLYGVALQAEILATNPVFFVDQVQLVRN
jgi:hypothetical protein